MASTPSRAGRARRLLFWLHVLALVAALLGAAAVAHQQRRATRGIVAGLPDATLADRPASIVGLNVALEQYEDPAPVLASLRGIPWLRQTYPWDRIEPAQGAFDWAPWDRIVGAATAGGHSLIAVLNHSPGWARAPGLPTAAPPASPADFARFAGELAARYGDRIDVYQIWDEPNLFTGWGDQPPSAAAYAALLQAAYTAIHAADPTATVLAAALAPTVESGPDNVSDLLYLQQLYDLGAAPYFDAAAGKPYGFHTGPDDRLADPAVLNFSRFVLLREVMARNGDGHKLLWGGNYGWNNRPSPWGHASAADQRAFTRQALERAAREWPWAGVLALETLQPPVPPDDPRWGFAVLAPSGAATPLLADLQALSGLAVPAQPGNHPAQHPAAAYTGAWEFSELGADIPTDYANAAVEFTFIGSEVGLRVRRGDYRAHLYVTVDGRPANRLPSDEHGAYLILTAPETNTPQVTTILAAAGLAPGPHTLTIRPERGWDQWALVGFAVGGPSPAGPYRLAMVGLLAIAALAAAGALFWSRGLGWDRAIPRLRGAWERLGGAGQAALAVGAGGVLYLTSWLTWGQDVLAVTRRSGDAVPLLITALTAGLFYFSPSLLLALAALAALFVICYLRPDLGLALAALFIPFFLQYRLLWQRGFSMVEVCTLLTFGAIVLRWVATFARAPRRPALRAAVVERFGRLSALDWAALAYLLIASLSTAHAAIFPVAFREYRLVILEPVIFYGLVRAVRLDRAGLWRLVDFFVLGAVLVAGYGLYQAVAGVGLITAEGGIARITSVYGSPNNLALYLERALPLAAAGWLLGGGGALPQWRRWAYALAGAVMIAAAGLTFSRGALLLGIPAGLTVVVIGWLGRRGWWLTLGAAALSLAALPLLARLPRFASLLDTSSGTSFFRVRLWLSAWRMFADHPWLGVGPDNFLYLYRSRYILPEAWQEPNLSHPHNLALDFLSRLGVLGFAAGLWLLLGFWRVALAVQRRLGRTAAPERRSLLALNVGLMGLVAAMLAHGLVDHGLFLVDLAYAFFLALALVQHLERLTSGEPSL